MKKKVSFLVLCFILTTMFSSESGFAETVTYKDGKAKLEKVSYVDAEKIPFQQGILEEKNTYLASGIKESQIVSVGVENQQHVDYCCEVDLTNPTTEILTSYADYDASNENWKMDSLSNQVEAAETATGKNIVAGINGDFFLMASGEPCGVLIMDGKVYQNVRYVNENGNDDYRNFFAIKKDGTATIVNGRNKCYDKETDTYTPLKDGQYQYAVGGDRIILKNGKITDEATGEKVTKPVIVQTPDSSSYRAKQYTRTAVGIKKDGTVVFYVTTGTNKPLSYGYSYQEIAKIMQEKGCYIALMLDGGGSSTYVSKHAGEAQVTCRNAPSDGAERLISSSILIASSQADSSSNMSLTACEKNGHDYIHTKGKITCTTCSFSQEASDFSGLTKDAETGRYILFRRGEMTTGFVPYGLEEMYYFDDNGLGKKSVLIEDIKTTCTKRGYRVYQDKPTGKTYKVNYAQAPGHIYAKVNGQKNCTVCGWTQVSLYDCDIKLSYKSCSYTGKERFPTVTVTATDSDGKKKTLEKGSDYTLNYWNNKNPGEASVSVMPISQYTGDKVNDRGTLKNKARTLNYAIKLYAPKNLRVTSKGLYYINLKWDKQDAVTGYKLYKYDTRSKTYKLYKTLVGENSNTYKVSNLYSGTIYRFKVRSYVGQRNGLISNLKGTVTRPRQGAIASLSKGKGSITVKWKRQNYTGYQIKYSTSRNFSHAKYIRITDEDQVKKTIKGLRRNKKYYVKVRNYKYYNGTRYYGYWSKTKSITTR